MKTEMVSFPSNGHMASGYLATPDDDADHAAVVVIQEWWGLVPHIKEMCERFAGAGFVALAPDLYHGRQADEPDEARKLAMALDLETALQEIRGSASYLSSRDDVQPRQVGVVGWCMGGMATFHVAVAPGTAPIGAVVGFYGRPPEDEQIASLDIPVMGLFGELDEGIPVEAVRTFEQSLQTHGKTHDMRIYPMAHHAFFNNTRPVYDAAAADDAWQRTLDWFNTHLRA